MFRQPSNCTTLFAAICVFFAFLSLTDCLHVRIRVGNKGVERMTTRRPASTLSERLVSTKTDENTNVARKTQDLQAATLLPEQVLLRTQFPKVTRRMWRKALAKSMKGVQTRAVARARSAATEARWEKYNEEVLTRKLHTSKKVLADKKKKEDMQKEVEKLKERARLEVLGKRKKRAKIKLHNWTARVTERAQRLAKKRAASGQKKSGIVIGAADYEAKLFSKQMQREKEEAEELKRAEDVLVKKMMLNPLSKPKQKDVAAAAKAAYAKKVSAKVKVKRKKPATRAKGKPAAVQREAAAKTTAAPSVKTAAPAATKAKTAESSAIKSKISAPESAKSQPEAPAATKSKTSASSTATESAKSQPEAPTATKPKTSSSSATKSRISAPESAKSQPEAPAATKPKTSASSATKPTSSAPESAKSQPEAQAATKPMTSSSSATKSTISAPESAKSQSVAVATTKPKTSAPVTKSLTDPPKAQTSAGASTAESSAVPVEAKTTATKAKSESQPPPAKEPPRMSETVARRFKKWASHALFQTKLFGSSKAAEATEAAGETASESSSKKVATAVSEKVKGPPETELDDLSSEAKMGTNTEVRDVSHTMEGQGETDDLSGRAKPKRRMTKKERKKGKKKRGKEFVSEWELRKGLKEVKMKKRLLREDRFTGGLDELEEEEEMMQGGGFAQQLEEFEQGEAKRAQEEAAMRKEDEENVLAPENESKLVYSDTIEIENEDPEMMEDWKKKLMEAKEKITRKFKPDKEE